MKSRNNKRGKKLDKLIIWIAALSLVSSGVLGYLPVLGSNTADAAEVSEETIDPLKPEDLTFRKVSSHRNQFSTEVVLNEMDFGDAAVKVNNAVDAENTEDGQLVLENTGEAEENGRIPLGGHAPYSTYDLEVTELTEGSSVGLELYKDGDNRVSLRQEAPRQEHDPSFYKENYRVDMDNIDELVVYNDQSLVNKLEKTERGLKFIGGDRSNSDRGENFVVIDKAEQGITYEVTVIEQGASYGNAIIKLRKDSANGIFLVTNAQGNLTYEIFKGGSSQGGSKAIKNGVASRPYTMQVTIEGKELIFTRIVGGVVESTVTVDVSSQFDLSDPAVLEEFEVVFGGRGGGSAEYVEYTSASTYQKIDERYDMDFDSDLTVYNDQNAQNDLKRIDSGLRFEGQTGTRGENFVPIGYAQQGLTYEATVIGQGSSYGNAIIKLRKDSKNGIFLVTNAAGIFSYEVFKNGDSVSGSVTIKNGVSSRPYTMQVSIEGKNLVFTRLVNGIIDVAKTVDVSAYFDLSDPEVLKEFEVVFGCRGAVGEYVEYSNAGMMKSGTAGDGIENYGELILDVYAGGTQTVSVVLDRGEMEFPFTIRADFAAESIRDTGSLTRRGFLSVWKVEHGKSELLDHNIELKGIDFSDPKVEAEYTPSLYYNLQSGGKAAVSEFYHYLTGGAAQADPKPLHDETGAIIQEGDFIWIAMTVRGYNINSSYQGIYSFNLRSGELELVGIMAFNLNGRDRYAPYHASDIIYNSMDDEWIVMTTAHNESPHAVKSGLIPQDPRETSFQFVDVTEVKYPDQSNEEDASLIYDYEAGKWRLVMCDSGSGGYQLPLYEADTWDGEYKEIARYAQAPCTGIQLQMLDGQYYVFFGRNTDNCEALRYPQMDNPVKLNIQSSPRSYNVWPVIIPFEDSEAGVTRYFMLSFDRDTHGGAHSYGNVYLYEAEEYPGMPLEEEKEVIQETELIENGEIYTAQQLMQIRNKLDGDYKLMNDIDLSGIANWVPIGDRENPFTGSFDGNGFILGGLNISREKTDQVGLFGYVGAEGSIQNTTVVQANVKGRIYVGILAGYNAGKISGCAVDGNVCAYASGGGLAGMNIGMITDSASKGSVTGTGGDSIGGFVGTNSGNVGTISLNTKGIVKNSSADAAVTGQKNVGGFIGYNDCGNISDCASSGDVNGYAYVGGFAGNIGRNYGNNSTAPVSYSFSTGEVNGNYSVGGFAGHNDGALTQCFSVGDVSGIKRVGGLSGYNNSKAAITASFTSGDVQGDVQVGGAFGHNRGTIHSAGADTNENVIGNSKRSAFEITAPDFQAAETYSAAGPLSGFGSSGLWTFPEGGYPLQSQSAEAPSYYSVTAEEKDGVTIDFDRIYVEEGQTVTFTLKLDEGVELEAVKVNDLELEIQETGVYSFVMPNENVVITVTVKEEAMIRQLRELVREAEALIEDDYTVGSWEYFYKHLESAKAILDKEEPGEREIQHAYNMLNLAMKLLEPAADKTFLTIVIEAADEAIESGEVDAAIPSVQAMFYNAYNTAIAIKEDNGASQEAIDKAAFELLEQLWKLGILKGNKEALADLVALCESVSLEDYADDDYKAAFTAALSDARRVLTDEEAIALEIEEAYDRLLNAALELNPRESAMDLLEEALKIAAEILENMDLYVEAGKAEFLEAYSAASKLYDDGETDQQKVEQAAKNLLEAMARMRYKADKKVLEQLVEEASMLDVNSCPQVLAVKLAGAVEQARTVLLDEELSVDEQDIVDNTVLYLQSMINEIKEFINGQNETEETKDESTDSTGNKESEEESNTDKSSEETKDTKDTKDTNVSGKGNGQGKDGKGDSVRTGDASQSAVLFVLTLLSAAAIGIIVKYRNDIYKRNERK